MMISISSAAGFILTLSFIVLLGSIGVLIHSEKLLGRCKNVLDFAFFIAARQDEWDSLLDGDENNHDALMSHEGYKKGYADGEYEGMRRFKVEQEVKSDERTSTSEASKV